MRKCLVLFTVALLVVMGVALNASAHFQLILPSDDLINDGEDTELEIQLIFSHPSEASHTMNMEKPELFSVYRRGKEIDLTNTLEPFTFNGGDAWKTSFDANGFGDFLFYLVPTPYYESAEDKYITQITKVVVNNLGMPTDWDAELGLQAEIVPLNKPYGLWVGNVFQGIVKMDGKPVPYAEIEVEHLNSQSFSGLVGEEQFFPSDAHITQLIRADENGVFTYGIPKSGWWGFAALMEAEKIDDKDHEMGAVMWIKAYDM
ncbi:MAG: ATP-dependent DNA ligase [Candidatus Cloacimonas sp. SDB]|nr:MAG: ATP-dependent DNA ligase [Candidatus Cloacimonas sp. SDB]